MNILLVYPKYPDTFWSFKHVMKFVSRKAAFPPLGLLTVASMLPAEWNKKLIDLNVEPLTDSDLLWADLVFVSAMIVQKQSVREVIDRCKSVNRKVVAGGPLFSTSNETFAADYFVLNEAEVTLPLFLRDFEEGKPKHIYSSIERPDITQTPIPQWSLINQKNYVTMLVQNSRGCPFNCEFCDILVLNGRVPRTKKPEQFIAEIENLYTSGWRGSVFIVDDNFIGNKVHVKQMLPELIQWQKKHKYPFSFFTEASTNLADDEELMNLMSVANFNKVFLGIETPSLEGLKECGKFQNTKRDLQQTVKKINEHGMQVMAGFIVGFDSDREDVFETQIQFIQKTGVVTAMVGLLNALPQTRLWNRLKAEGRLTSETTGGNTDGHLNFTPKMNKEKLLQGYKRVLKTIYSRKQYYQRINTFIKQYKPTVRTKIRKQDIRALLRSMWHIGIVSNSRIEYWKLLVKTSALKHKALPIAVELAILGLHFEKIAGKLL